MQVIFYLFRTVTIVPASRSCSILPFFSQNMKRQPRNKTAIDRSIQTARSNALPKAILSPVSKSDTFISCSVMPNVPWFFARPAKRKINDDQYREQVYAQHAHDRCDETEKHHDKQQVDHKCIGTLGKRSVFLRLMELRDLVIVQLRVTVWANRILSADIRAAMYTEQALVLLNILAAIIYDRTSFVNSNSLCYCNENAFSVRYQKMCDFKILCYTSSSMAGFCPFYFLLCFFHK